MYRIVHLKNYHCHKLSDDALEFVLNEQLARWGTDKGGHQMKDPLCTRSITAVEVTVAISITAVEVTVAVEVKHIKLSHTNQSRH